MRKYFRSVALIPRDPGDRSHWLCLWSPERSCFDFIAGEPRDGESFRECIQRQVAHELDLRTSDFLVANMAQLNLECADVLPGQTDPQHLGVAFFIVNLYREAARQIVRAHPRSGWLGSDELLEGTTSDGSPVNPVVTHLLRRSGVIQVRHGELQ